MSAGTTRRMRFRIMALGCRSGAHAQAWIVFILQLRPELPGKMLCRPGVLMRP